MCGVYVCVRGVYVVDILRIFMRVYTYYLYSIQYLMYPVEVEVEVPDRMHTFVRICM